MACDQETLRNVPLFALLDDDERAVLAAQVDVTRFVPRQRIYKIGDPGEDLTISEGDSAPYVPRSIVTNPYFDWSEDRRPRVAWHDTVIYEAHVKGMTVSHPEVPQEQRGT